MALPYPITSYGSRYVELTGGAFSRLENRIITFFEKMRENADYNQELQIMSAEELQALGLVEEDIALIVKSSDQK